MSALTTITRRAKQIRKIHPGISWKSAIKKSSAEYRCGKKTIVRRKKRSAPKRKRRIIPIKRHTDCNKPEFNISIASLKNRLKNKMKEGLGRLLLRKELSTTRRAKKKIQRSIMAVKSQLRKIV